MLKSDSITKLAVALAKAQAAFKPAPKSSINPHFKNRYTDLATLWEHCRPVLAENGLAIVQTFEEATGCIAITTTLLHTSGEYIGGTLTLPMDKQTPQAAGSAITYGRRYAMAAILGMVSDEDDDAEGATNRNGNGDTGAPKSRLVDDLL